MKALGSLNMSVHTEMCFSLWTCVKDLSSSRPNWNMSFRIWFVMVCSPTGLIPEMFAVFCAVYSSVTQACWQAGGTCLVERCRNTGLPLGLDLLLTACSLQRHRESSTPHKTGNKRQQRASVGPQAYCCY